MLSFEDAYKRGFWRIKRESFSAYFKKRFEHGKLVPVLPTH